MSILSRFATKEPAVCAVCRRHAEGLAYAPRADQPMIWLCDHPDCHSLARKVYRMPEAKLDLYEHAAAQKAGEQVGAYLDSLNKTDLAVLTEAEWQEMLRLFYTGFEQELRRKLLANEAPF